MKPASRSSAIFLGFLLLVGAFIWTRLLDSTILENVPGSSTLKQMLSPSTTPPVKKIEYPFNCTAYNLTGSCPAYPTSSYRYEDLPSTSMCPEYFRWIHEDLRPWALTGITEEMLERAKTTANFRLIILKGKAYVEQYQKAFQTRDVFTLWGILQLLRRYPGRIPDLDLMFDCIDWPVIKSADYIGPDALTPPPLFRYCGDDTTLDIVFPDWSFWGWPETNIRPWQPLLEDIKEGNKKATWMEREPYAYWKGNPEVADTRKDLMKCNVSNEHDWNARLYEQNWTKATKEGFKKSSLANQCNHRYKIYIEGSAWSVSEKYILACNSVTLLVKPHYYDFFTRGLIPLRHFWPIKPDDKCRSIKFAVDWGNSHTDKAEAIGRAASNFTREDLKMDNVYDYMFHLLNEYAKLLRFKPSKSPGATELCSEKMACAAEGLEKKFMMESLVNNVAETKACSMPSPLDPPSLNALLRRQQYSVEQVEAWESKYWENQNTQS